MERQPKWEEGWLLCEETRADKEVIEAEKDIDIDHLSVIQLCPPDDRLAMSVVFFIFTFSKWLASQKAFDHQQSSRTNDFVQQMMFSTRRQENHIKKGREQEKKSTWASANTNWQRACLVYMLVKETNSAGKGTQAIRNKEKKK